jgi:death-on-curing protein
MELNRAAVQATGEPFNVMSPNLLESACARPENHFHYDSVDDLAVLATTLLFGLAQNHPFEQGNKRTGFAAADVFLILNGFDLMIPDDVAIADLIKFGLEDETSRATVTDIFRRSIRPA